MRMAASLPNQSPIHVPEGAASAPRQSADACVSPAVSLAADCGSFQQTLDRTIRFVQDDVFVDRSHLSVLHDDLAVNNGRFDVGSGGGVEIREIGSTSKDGYMWKLFRFKIAMSAFLPSSKLPICFSKPTARAPPMVAIRKTLRAFMAVGP